MAVAGEVTHIFCLVLASNGLLLAIVQKDALIQYTKHAAPKIIAPENNPDADAYVFGYRMVGIAKAYKNMLSGMYFSHDKA